LDNIFINNNHIKREEDDSKVSIRIEEGTFRDGELIINNF
jgi:hypothetical protein